MFDLTSYFVTRVRRFFFCIVWVDTSLSFGCFFFFFFSGTGRVDGDQFFDGIFCLCAMALGAFWSFVDSTLMTVSVDAKGCSGCLLVWSGKVLGSNEIGCCNKEEGDIWHRGG